MADFLGNKYATGKLIQDEGSNVVDGRKLNFIGAGVNAVKNLTTGNIDVTITGAASNEFADNVFRVTDDLDNTKKLAFQCSAIATLTTRTITIPDKDGTLATLADVSGEANTTSNSGTGEGLALAKSGIDLPMKSITANDGSVALVANASELDIKVTDLGIVTGKIGPKAVTFDKIKDVNQNRLLGRVSVGAGVTEEITPTNARTLLNVADGAEVNPAVISQAEAEAGTSTTERIFTAQRVKQAIAALETGGGGGGSDIGAKVTNSSSQSLTSAVVTTLNFDTESYDTDSIHDTVTNNSRLTIKTAGKYVIVAGMRYTVAITTGNTFFRLLKNGTINLAVEENSGSTMRAGRTCSFIGDFAVNDYVEMQAQQNTGSSKSTDTSYTFFSIQKIDAGG